jgi:hypothetical protein
MGLVMVPLVFISSTYLANRDVREHLAVSLRNEGFRVAIAEPIQGTSGFLTRERVEEADIVEISDTCLQQLAASDIVVCVLSGSLGSSIQFRDTCFRAKHFELELLSTLLQRKPMFLCSLPDFSPDSETRSFVECVLQDEATNHVRSETPAKLIISATEFCNRIRREGQQLDGRRGGSISHLTRGLSIQRASYRSVRSHQMLLPFLGELRVEASIPNIDRALQALEDAKKQGDLHLRIGRLWIALRELLPTKPQDVNDPAVSLVWQDLLSSWVNSASWYGLHAHVHLGAVAAATGLWHIRCRNRSLGYHEEMPVNQMASTNYSLIQQIPGVTTRHFAYRSLRRFLDRHMHLSSEVGSNLLVRGSINLRLGNPIASAFDFRRALQLFEGQNATQEQIGDAKTHLALPLAWMGFRGQARLLMDEGLIEMRNRVEPGHLLRALRKAIQIEDLPLGDKDRAEHFRKEVGNITMSAGYLDQMRHFIS